MKGPEMGTLFWIVWMVPRCHPKGPGPYKRDRWRLDTEKAEDDVTMEAEI